MQLGLVVGFATATVKHRTMQGQKLLVVQPLLADGSSPDGDPILAVDTLGCGRDETVVLTSDGRWVRGELGDGTPVRWSVLGTRDEQKQDR